MLSNNVGILFPDGLLSIKSQMKLCAYSDEIIDRSFEHTPLTGDDGQSSIYFRLCTLARECPFPGSNPTKIYCVGFLK